MLLEHLQQHGLASLLGDDRVAPGLVAARCRDQPDEQRGLPDRHLLQVAHMEVALRGGTNAVETIAEVHSRQVLVEDLVLG